MSAQTNRDQEAGSRTLKRFHYSTDQAIEKPFNWKQMLRLFSFMKPYAKTILPIAILGMVLSTAVRLFAPILIGSFALDHIIEHGDVNFLWIMVGVIAFMYVISYIGNTLRIKYMNKLGQLVIFDMRKKLFNHIQRLSHRFFDQRSAGSILVRITNDVNSLQDLFTNGVINLLMDLIMLIGIVILLFVISPSLTVAIMIVLPLMFFISTRLRRNIRRSWQDVRIKQSMINSHLNESIQGIRVTQSYTQENENIGFFKKMNQTNFEAWRNATQKSAMFRPFVEMSGAIGTAILLSFGVFLIQMEALTIGEFFAFSLYIGMFWEPISRLGQVYNQLLVGMASSERIFEFLDEQPSVPEKMNAKTLKDIDGHIQFDHVEFAYDEKRKALHDMSIEIKGGQTVALVGHTGSGKTTIVNLISRFYDPTKGRILLDGHDLRDIRLDSLREKVSIVLQDTFIFSGTIMDNIRFGRPDATDEEVKQAAYTVGADGFIQELPNGYETEVEERGNILSVGERQLISFARALLADPQILILDEATAAIDTETEQIIQAALRKLLHGRTAIMIAHRLSTIREADRIFVLEQGKILEQGDHDDLMAQRGEYYELVKSQFNALNTG
ncbi:ABC transporter ATP-binding protein [Salisediminibacterium selenitireducens]|uniref:ABC transporter related protein n=1 Tax=Bacillus selenitireducens (strain ATCC 700615 / DSM 15326 / MLS10) TaxID=439292 RepID=D6XTQ6_BACIE|nr:ABC transporter ATP-binding protein [Salisediminibacterium selenitireducens]ADH99192.1 ABC transporter related protein [[Bacillus] selenitireducens MLS10]